MRIEVREYVKRGANGDRDRGPGSEYSDFQVVFIRDGAGGLPKAEWCALNVSGYDDRDSMLRVPGAVRSEAATFANAASTFFDVDGPVWRRFRAKPPKPQPIEWEEVES
jgi:hypothetical protein